MYSAYDVIFRPIGGKIIPTLEFIAEYESVLEGVRTTLRKWLEVDEETCNLIIIFNKEHKVEATLQGDEGFVTVQYGFGCSEKYHVTTEGCRLYKSE